MKVKEYLTDIKKKMEEEKNKKKELEEKANFNVYSWYELYDKNYKAAGVGFIMPESFEICTSTTSYRHDAAAASLFLKHFGKDLTNEEVDKKIPWFNLIPKYYNTICFELVSPYSSSSNILVFLPDKINEFQKEMLYKMQNEIDYYNENVNLKVKYHAGYKDDEADFDRVEDILDAYYKEDIISEGSEYHGKI